MLHPSVLTTSNCAKKIFVRPFSLLRLCAAALTLLLLLLLLLLLDYLQLLLLLELRGAHRHRYRLAVGDLVDEVAAPSGRHGHLELSARPRGCREGVGQVRPLDGDVGRGPARLTAPASQRGHNGRARRVTAGGGGHHLHPEGKDSYNIDIGTLYINFEV